MSWFSNLIRGKHPMTRGADGPLARPPAGGPSPGLPAGSPVGPPPGTTIGPKTVGSYNPQTPYPTTGVNRTGGNMAGPDFPDAGPTNFDWGTVGNFLVEHWDDIAKLGLGALTTREAIQNANKSSQLMEQGVNMAKEDYAGRAPFRDAALTKMLDPRTPDLSSLFADPSNPFTKGRSVPVVGNRIPVSAKMPVNVGDPTTADQFALGDRDTPLAPPGAPQGVPITNPPHMPRFKPEDFARNVVPSVGRRY